MLDRISRKQDGTVAAANTANRKRMVLGNAMDYACEIGALPSNPLQRIKWTKPRALRTVYPAVVINSTLARQFLAAVGRQGQRGKRLQGFFGCLYYAGLRPEEAIDLGPENLISLPETGCGEMRLTHSQPRSGAKWTDSGRSRERRELKHRAAGDSRLVPVHPELVTLLRDQGMQAGTRDAARTIALLSPDYLESVFGSAEWQAAWASDRAALAASCWRSGCGTATGRGCWPGWSAWMCSGSLRPPRGPGCGA
jgi:integrase